MPNDAAGESIAEYNYATFLIDEANGLEYITDVATKRRLYRLEECDLCGMRPLSWTGHKNGWACCSQHLNKERNDNDPDLLSLVP